MIEIRFHGRGGQGSVVASRILAYAFFLDGYHTQAFPTYGAERRGAPVAAYVRVDEKFIWLRSPVKNPDYVIVMNGRLADTIDISSGIKDGGIIIVNSEKPADSFTFKRDCKVVSFDVNAIALKFGLGSKIMPIINVPILGVFAKVTKRVSLDALKKAAEKFVPVHIDKNILALEEAYKLA